MAGPLLACGVLTCALSLPASLLSTALPLTTSLRLPADLTLGALRAGPWRNGACPAAGQAGCAG